MRFNHSTAYQDGIDAGKAEALELVKAAQGVLIYLPIETDFPEPSHPGLCTPGITTCDGNCQDRAHLAEYNSKVVLLNQVLSKFSVPIQPSRGYDQRKET